MADVVKKATRHGYSEGLVELAAQHEDIICLDADLGSATGSQAFRKAYPDRYIEAGIAEQDLIGMAAGLARTGLSPFANSFAVFAAGRAFEIIRNSVCYPNLNVKIVGSHCGITPAGDGGSHQCIEDVAAMRALPNMTVLSPCDFNQAKLMVKLLYEHKGPCYMRTSREPMPIVTSLEDKIEIGKAQILRHGSDVCVVATGVMTALAVSAVDELAAEGVNAELVNIHTIKPLDMDTIAASVKKCGGKVLVCEEANMYGGLGEAVAYGLVGTDGIKFDHVAVMDRFGQSGLSGELLEEYGITSANIKAHAAALAKR
ncbi:MAG: transketolase family protein [Firmicutes bacterium]|nr:transketolase family protein [Bacillota bacterium]